MPYISATAEIMYAPFDLRLVMGCLSSTRSTQTTYECFLESKPLHVNVGGPPFIKQLCEEVNMRLLVRIILLTSCVLIMFGPRSYGQTNAPNETPPVPPAPTPAHSTNQGSGRVGIGVKASTLGGGAEVAFRVTDRTNVRTGFNMISYSRGFSKDGIAYNGQLSFKTVEAHFDFFPFAGSFHISPGVLAYIGDPITGHAS